MGERGNAPAEFVLVSALLVSLVLGLLQVLFVGYARHALTAAASEGARQASLPDVSGEQALALTRALITQSLSETYASEVSLARSTRLGIPTSEMIITAPIPVLGLWTTGGTEDIHADRVAGGSLCRQTRSLERRKAEPEIEDGDKQRN